MEYFNMPLHGVSELLVVFALGALVGRVLGYRHYCRQMLRRHENVQHVIMPFEERFRSPLKERKWPAFGAPKSARTNRWDPPATPLPVVGEPAAFEIAGRNP